MSKITCDVIKDLLPLYYDEVCSSDSRKIVEGHLNQCLSCSNDLNKISAEIKLPVKTVEKNLSDTAALKDMAAFWKRSKVKAFVVGLTASAVLITLLFLGFTWPIINVSTKVIKITEVSRLQDGSVAYHYELTDGYESKMSKFQMDDDGNFYITPKRPIIRTKALTGGEFSLANMYQVFDDFYRMVYKNKYGEDAEIKSLYYGTPKDKILVWKEGMNLPEASAEVEANFKRK
jgi:hypothetical protein